MIEERGVLVAGDLLSDLLMPLLDFSDTAAGPSGRNSSRTKTFDATDGETVAFRCSGKSISPIFLRSFVVPSLALSLHRV